LNDFDGIDVELTDSDSPERMTATGYKIKGTGIVLMNMTRSRGGQTGTNTTSNAHLFGDMSMEMLANTVQLADRHEPWTSYMNMHGKPVTVKYTYAMASRLAYRPENTPFITIPFWVRVVHEDTAGFKTRSGHSYEFYIHV